MVCHSYAEATHARMRSGGGVVVKILAMKVMTRTLRILDGGDDDDLTSKMTMPTTMIVKAMTLMILIMMKMIAVFVAVVMAMAINSHRF